ncbi:peptide-methionine (S)-S-oxide reductase MsrA [uncultured Roseobacter sp.]|uniref:peptide-methionine (S)-S-oxide reductase MsrA n=1 Tax=uncultured Roseobacter sp. TaxID=114847 RepID=UPI00261BCEB9|nr:peptide-methionine (S)-S-oxide reductase MsrA [uncultured Roseobacter sp.]
MLKYDTLKSIALAGMIAFALTTQGHKAEAADLETLTVAGGCFWCVEADFEKVKGVKGAVSGFAGGIVQNPTYKQVTAGGTGHYEAVQITYDPSVVDQRTLLDLFFRSVDPTDAGGQFCDRGESYRTAIFVDGPNAEKTAKAAKAKAEADLGQRVVTPVLPAGEFYPADAYHQDYYKGRQLVITRFGPKRQASAYKAYREACGRDARVKELWGSAAPFAGS